MADLRFGLKLSQHAPIEDYRYAWQVADDVGFEHCWVMDHFATIGGAEDGDIFEAWTMQAAMAVATRRTRVGCMVTGNTYRHPGDWPRWPSPSITSPAAVSSSVSGPAGRSSSTRCSALSSVRPASGWTDWRRLAGSSGRCLETLLADGKVRAIGVSNFMVDHLAQLLGKATVVPAVNQIELHPYFQQREVQALDDEHGILTQAWSPIGGITFYRDGSHGSTLENPVIGAIARTHDKSPAQVMLRWHLQEGRPVSPKSTKADRIKENFDVFDFDLTDDELAAVDGLDTGQPGGPEPAEITLESFGRPIPEA